MKSNVRAVVLRVIARERERGAYLCIKKLYVYTPLTYVENITSVQVLYTDKTSVHILIEDKFVLLTGLGLYFLFLERSALDCYLHARLHVYGIC